MPVPHYSKFFAVTDAKLAKLTADPAGGAAAYAALIDVPGIKGVTVTGDVKTSELRGDNTLLDTNSVLTNIKATISYAKLSLDVLAAVLGGTTVDSGVTPNMKATWDLAGTDAFSYFKLEGRTSTGGVDPVGGDGHILLHKLMLSAFPDLGLAEEDYQLYSMEASASPLLATGNRWVTVTINETQVAIT